MSRRIYLDGLNKRQTYGLLRQIAAEADHIVTVSLARRGRAQAELLSAGRYHEPSAALYQRLS